MQQKMQNIWKVQLVSVLHKNRVSFTVAYGPKSHNTEPLLSTQDLSCRLAGSVGFV